MRRGFEVLCEGEQADNGVRPLFLMRLRVERDQLVTTGEIVPVRGVASDLSAGSARVGRTGGFLVGTHRSSDRTGQVFEIHRRGRAIPVLALPAAVGPKYALPPARGDCRAWAGEQRENNNVYDVSFARDPQDVGVAVHRSTIGVDVLAVDCSRERVWVLEPKGWRVMEIDSNGTVVGEHPTADLTAGPFSSRVSGLCSLGVFGDDLRLYCGQTQVGTLPLPTRVGDPQVALSEGIDQGGFIAFHSQADKYVLVHEAAPDGFVGDWITIPIPGNDAVRLAGVVANRTHVCAQWTLEQPPHSSRVPTTFACIPRP